MSSHQKHDNRIEDTLPDIDMDLEDDTTSSKFFIDAEEIQQMSTFLKSILEDPNPNIDTAKMLKTASDITQACKLAQEEEERRIRSEKIASFEKHLEDLRERYPEMNIPDTFIYDNPIRKAPKNTCEMICKNGARCTREAKIKHDDIGYCSLHSHKKIHAHRHEAISVAKRRIKDVEGDVVREVKFRHIENDIISKTNDVLAKQEALITSSIDHDSKFQNIRRRLESVLGDNSPFATPVQSRVSTPYTNTPVPNNVSSTPVPVNKGPPPNRAPARLQRPIIED